MSTRRAICLPAMRSMWAMCGIDSFTIGSTGLSTHPNACGDSWRPTFSQCGIFKVCSKRCSSDSPARVFLGSPRPTARRGGWSTKSSSTRSLTNCPKGGTHRTLNCMWRACTWPVPTPSQSNAYSRSCTLAVRWHSRSPHRLPLLQPWSLCGVRLKSFNQAPRRQSRQRSRTAAKM